MEIYVECYAGYCGEEEPRRLRLGQRQVQVVEVLSYWLDPEHRYFKLRGDDGLYTIRHDTLNNYWQLTLFDGRCSEVG